MKSRSAATPFALWMSIFTVVPMAIVVWFAFTDESGAFTMANIAQIWQYAGTYVDSIWMGALATVICLVLAYPVALGISRKSEHMQRTMVMIVMLPMWMNFLLRTYAWMSLLENNGLINQFLGSIGIKPLEMINTDGAIVLGMVYNFLPFMILPLYSVMAKLDNRIIEAAQAMGCSTFQIVTKVMLPECKPSLITGFTTATITILSYGAMAGAIGGGGLGAMALLRGHGRQERLVLYITVLLLVILVQVIQSIGTHLAVKTDRRIQNTQK